VDVPMTTIPTPAVPTPAILPPPATAPDATAPDATAPVATAPAAVASPARNAAARRGLPPEADAARIIGVGTAVPAESYSQQDILDAFGVEDPRIRSIFLNSAIDRRHLTLPPLRPDGTRALEDQGQLLAKHKAQAVDMGVRAIEECLKRTGLDLADIGYLCCVTTTGFLTPGLSALIIRELGIDPHSSRLDVVGMGCNAGLNALNAVAGWARAHPGQPALMVCAEACSAAYVFDGTMRTSVVNSLFGDGAAAVAVLAGESDLPLPRAEGPGCCASPATSSPTPSKPCATTGTARRTGSASSSTRPCPMSSARTPRSWSTGCWPGPGCGAATSPTGWCTRAARRSSTPSASIWD